MESRPASVHVPRVTGAGRLGGRMNGTFAGLVRDGACAYNIGNGQFWKGPMTTPPSRLPRLVEAATRSSLPAALQMPTEALQRFLAQCHRRRYAAKVPVIRPGDAAGTLFYIIEGSASVLTEDEGGRELILAYLNRGDFIGEMGMFVETPRRDVLVRTRSVCEMAEITYERLFRLLEGPLRDESARLLFAIGAQLTTRLLHTSRKVSRLAFLDVTNRIARTLVDLCQEPDAMTHPDGTQIRVSRQEISRLVGCSREMAGRVLKQLEEQGKITVSGKSVVVLGQR